MLETTFDFEELQLPEFGEGALFYGQATLTGGDDDFVISSIRLANGMKLDRPPNDGPGLLSAQLFTAICDVLYDDRPVRKGGSYVSTLGAQCAYEWSDFISQARAA